MKRLIETPVFVALAVGVHLALLLRFDDSDGAESGGQGGAAMVSIAASSASVETMVADWEKPPETTQAAPRLTAPAPVQAESPPQRPDTRPDLAPARTAAVSLPSAPVNSLAKPTIDLSTPPPPEPKQITPPEPALAPLPEPVVTPDPLPPEAPSPPSSKRPIPRPESKNIPMPEPRPAQKTKPARTTRPAREASQAQVSAGSGGSTQAGALGKSSVMTLNKSQKTRLQTVWGGKIRARIERQKRFPRGIKGKGRVVLRITIARDGRVISARIARSSGQPAFDKAAMSAVSRAGRMPRAPKGLEQPSYTFNLPVDFH